MNILLHALSGNPAPRLYCAICVESRWGRHFSKNSRIDEGLNLRHRVFERRSRAYGWQLVAVPECMMTVSGAAARRLVDRGRLPPKPVRRMRRKMSMSMGKRLLVVAIAATVLTTPPAVTANQAVMTRDTFLAATWRLTGLVFAAAPRGGFPITFHPDGTVVTSNLGGITRWSLLDDELVLSGDQRIEVIRLKWLPDRGVFRHCPVPSRIPLYVFPEAIKDPLSIGCGDVPAAILKLQIALDKAAYQPGEQIVATATLTNVGDAPIDIRRSADETGRSDGFRVELSKDSANAL
jgi:hypothetical protein